MCTQLIAYLSKFFQHNQGIAIGFVLIMLFLLWFVGCQSETQSLLDPQLKVTESVLNIEYTSELARLENELATLKTTTTIRLQDLHRQDELKQALFKNAMLIAESGNPNPLGMLSLAGTLLGVGAIIDNRKKDGLIKGLTNAKT